MSDHVHDDATCGALSPRLHCGLPLHPEHPADHDWALSTANAQDRANRRAFPERSAEESKARPRDNTYESTAQTLSQDEIRWMVQETYAVAYGNSTGTSVRDHHLAGLRAVADLLIDRHRRH